MDNGRGVHFLDDGWTTHAVALAQGVASIDVGADELLQLVEIDWPLLLFAPRPATRVPARYRAARAVDEADREQSDVHNLSRLVRHDVAMRRLMQRIEGMFQTLGGGGVEGRCAEREWELPRLTDVTDVEVPFDLYTIQECLRLGGCVAPPIRSHGRIGYLHDPIAARTASVPSDSAQVRVIAGDAIIVPQVTDEHPEGGGDAGRWRN